MILHTEGVGTEKCTAIMPNTACRWVTVTAPHPLQAPPACHHLLRTGPPLACSHALSPEVWWAMLEHRRHCITAPGTRWPPEPVLARL